MTYNPKEYWRAKGIRGIKRDRRLTWDTAVAKIDPNVEPELKHLVATISNLSPIKILDVGSGWGFIYQYLSRYGLELDYTACDFVDSMIALHEKATGVRPHKWDGKVLPFGDGVFDFILSYSVLIHVPPSGIEAIFSEHVRVSNRWLYIQAAREMSNPAPHCFNHDHLDLFDAYDLKIVDELESIDGRRVNWLLRKGKA